MIEPLGDVNPINYWLMGESSSHAEDSRFAKYTIDLQGNPTLFTSITEGDWVIISRSSGEVTRIGRILRKRSNLSATTFYFDRVLSLNGEKNLSSIGLSLSSSNAVSRAQTENFLNAAQKLLGKSLIEVPLIEDQTYIRELLQFAVMDDLLGPAGGPHEHIVDMGVRDRYLVGKLAPRISVRGGIEGVEGPSAPEETEEPTEETKAGIHQPGAEFPSSSGKVDPESDSADDTDASNNQSLIPSSFGMTFCIDGNVDSIQIEARWGRYEKIPSDENNYTKIINRKIKDAEGRVVRSEQELVKAKAWRRIPCGEKIYLKIKEGLIKPQSPDKDHPQILIQGAIRPKNAKGERLITLFLINDQEDPDVNKDAAWLFQPELIVRASDGEAAIFKRKPAVDIDGEDPERETLEMVYRNKVEFAVGHGISVHAKTSERDVTLATEIRSVAIPRYEVPFTDTPGKESSDRLVLKSWDEKQSLDMKQLASMPKDALIETLQVLVKDYSVWLSEQKKRVSTEIIGYDTPANEVLLKCQSILKRLEEGISALDNDPQALQAFRIANEAMALQRIRSLYALSRRRNEGKPLESFDIPKNRSWRTFQLAFILLSIPSISDPRHEDRTSPVDAVADLLWFPTGGGKTEAYLGVAAFTMAIRRLKKDLGGYDGSRGLSVLMRYTLRLLTLQQFQRATTLICAMESLRRAPNLSLGEHPFTMGLWVGNKVTPGRTKESHEAIQRIRNPDQGRPFGASPAQLTSCPWCGAKISPLQDIEVKKESTSHLGRTIIYCSDSIGRCEFSKGASSEQPHPGIPVVVVDEEIYARPPTMMIATVDKFAMMAWRGQSRTLFGIASQECDRHGLLGPDAVCSGNHNASRGLPRAVVREIRPIRPPDLIIQDEFHLISGPLGTMVGLYETAVDELSSWTVEGKKVRPKIIASTATVRKAMDQVNNVFMRKVAIFPPNGLDIGDNYFSIQRPIERRPGRKYMGICAPGSSRPAVLIRTYVAFLTAAQGLFNSFGAAADPYMTLVGYFNSLRELGGMKRLAEDDVQTRAFRVAMSLVSRPGLAHRKSDVIEELTSRVSSQDIPKRLDGLEVMFKAEYDEKSGKFTPKWEEGKPRAVDVVLATNMLSVGVDILRLGVMVVNGQPKGTAEYIQATSRVGRQSPGLVCSVLTWARPRDLSHYETYEHYHATFYKHVEAQSVTPFSPRAMDRGLTGTLVSLMRLKNGQFAPNGGAQRLSAADRAEIKDAMSIISSRAENVTSMSGTRELTEMGLKARADEWASEANRGGRILAYEKEGATTYPLLKIPGRQAWGRWTVPMSMREVEPGVRLMMDIGRLPEGPEWRTKPKKPDQGED